MPILMPEQVAKALVDGVQRKQRRIIVPSSWIQFPMFKLLLPNDATIALSDYHRFAHPERR